MKYAVERGFDVLIYMTFHRASSTHSKVVKGDTHTDTDRKVIS
jgi:hypothetical protein